MWVTTEEAELVSDAHHQLDSKMPSWCDPMPKTVRSAALVEAPSLVVGRPLGGMSEEEQSLESSSLSAEPCRAGRSTSTSRERH